MLDISPRLLEKVLYFASYIVTDPGETRLEKNAAADDKEYREMRETPRGRVPRRHGRRGHSGACWPRSIWTP